MAKLDIHNVYAHSFILSTITFLRTVCSPRYCVNKLKFLIPLFFGTPCIGQVYYRLRNFFPRALIGPTYFSKLQLDPNSDHNITVYASKKVMFGGPNSHPGETDLYTFIY